MQRPPRASASFLSIAFTLIAALATPHASSSARVTANLVFWDQARGFDTIVANADVIDDVSPYWYRVRDDGTVGPYETSYGTTYEDPAILSFLRDRGIRVIPTVANALNGIWDGALVSRIVSDPALASTNIASLVSLAVDNNYDGIDLDYEGLIASDRADFSAFVADLAAALHARGKILTVNVYAKTGEPGTWDGPMSQDWSAIGAVADYVRIMAYEYHWSTSSAGPIAPIAWVSDVLAFGRTVLPAAKMTLGFHLYGYDWLGQAGTALVWDDVIALLQRYGVQPEWDVTSAETWFQYVASKKLHTVWFADNRSVAARLQLATSYGVTSTNFWRLGGEDPAVWDAIREHLAGGSSGADTIAPYVVLISPQDGGTLARKQRIEAQSHDNVAVARVEFHVDGRLVATDTGAPYVTTWNTRRVASGPHEIKAIAYDLQGNSAESRIVAYK